MAINKKLEITSVGEDVEKREPLSLFVGGNVNWYSHYGKTVRMSLKKLKIEPPYNPVNFTSGYLSEKKNKTLIRKDIRTPIFIVVLLTVVKIWKQCKCPLMHGWIKKTHTHTQWNSNQP